MISIFGILIGLLFSIIGYTLLRFKAFSMKQLSDVYKKSRERFDEKHRGKNRVQRLGAYLWEGPSSYYHGESEAELFVLIFGAGFLMMGIVIIIGSLGLFGE